MRKPIHICKKKFCSGTEVIRFYPSVRPCVALINALINSKVDDAPE